MGEGLKRAFAAAKATRNKAGRCPCGIGPGTHAHNQPSTPELDKIKLVKERSQAIGEFLDWLGGEKGVILAKSHTHGPACAGWDEGRGRFNPRGDGPYCELGPDGRLWPYRKQTEDLLAEFFDIDLKKVEKERRALLAAIKKGGR